VYDTVPPKKTVTLQWDQTHTFNFVLTFANPGNWGINFTGNYGSGLPYTPLTARGFRMDEVYSARMPWTLTIDMRATKEFSFWGMNTTLFLDVTNILNRANVNTVWGNSGEPDVSVNWDTTLDWVERPNFFSQPRTIELGLSIGVN